jgi:hypothetical protein
MRRVHTQSFAGAAAVRRGGIDQGFLVVREAFGSLFETQRILFALRDEHHIGTDNLRKLEQDPLDQHHDRK